MILHSRSASPCVNMQVHHPYAEHGCTFMECLFNWAAFSFPFILFYVCLWPSVPPTIVTGTREAAVLQGNSVLFSINISSPVLPVPVVRWEGPQGSITSGSQYSLSQNSLQLTLPSSQRNDTGLYNVTATNAAGQDSFVFNLTVYSKTWAAGSVSISLQLWEESQEFRTTTFVPTVCCILVPIFPGVVLTSMGVGNAGTGLGRLWHSITSDLSIPRISLISSTFIAFYLFMSRLHLRILFLLHTGAQEVAIYFLVVTQSFARIRSSDEDILLRAVLCLGGLSFACLALHAGSLTLSLPHPVNIEQQAGTDFILQCIGGGFPAPVISWEFDGSALTSGMRDSRVTITSQLVYGKRV